MSSSPTDDLERGCRSLRVPWTQDQCAELLGVVQEGKTQSAEIGDPVTMLELVSLLTSTLARLFRGRHDLVVENMLLRHQLHVALRSRPRPDLKSGDRFFWLVVRSLYPDWKRHLILVRPETVVLWHREGWRLYGHWRSGQRLGRPRLGPEIRELIATMANENPLWATERIRGELLKLDIMGSSRSIRRYRWRRHSRPPSQSWRTFLANHAQAIWAADLFVIQTLTFQTIYVIFFISHGSRQLVYFDVTPHPTAAWVWRQLIEATPCDRMPRYLIHDRDRFWGANFGQRASGLAIKSLRTPIQAPRANSIAERWVRTARRECLDHLIPLSERHMRSVLAEFVDYYNHDRPHRSIGLQAPFPSLAAGQGGIMVRPVLGGLHHVYERTA